MKAISMWIGNVDGKREGLVIATSKTAAARIAGVSRSTFDRFLVRAVESCTGQRHCSIRARDALYAAL